MKNLDVLALDKTKIEGVVNGLNQLFSRSSCVLHEFTWIALECKR